MSSFIYYQSYLYTSHAYHPHHRPDIPRSMFLSLFFIVMTMLSICCSYRLNRSQALSISKVSSLLVISMIILSIIILIIITHSSFSHYYHSSCVTFAFTLVIYNTNASDMEPSLLLVAICYSALLVATVAWSHLVSY